ncbi:hypothetical protein ABK040_005153 [Willaertia magna]
MYEQATKVRKTDSLRDKKVQVNPVDVDKIIMAVTSKANWASKMEKLWGKWVKESVQQGVSIASIDVAFEILKEIELNTKGADKCCGNCCGTDTKKKKNSLCKCPCTQCVTTPKLLKSTHVDVCTFKDDIIPKELSERLKENMKVFENVPEEKKDWHPNSNNQVLDLIHPSLYCYVNGVSELVAHPFFQSKEKKRTVFDTIGTKVGDEKVICQWLPSQFKIKTNNQVEIKSYINNIDERRHKDLYDVIGRIFEHFIPLLQNYIKIKPDSNLQVIVKAANIIVTPDKPYYPGGTWHKEGMPYENIKASGIYYYESENVKASYLEFRDTLDEEEIDYKNAPELMFRNLGSVETKEGRCIAFPNTLQHRVRHFFPIDPTKPAIRKILVFFVVDPKNPIVSTEDVAIQRLDHLLSKYFVLAKKIPLHILYKSILPFLPHFTLEQAKWYRKELMAARKYKIIEDNKEYEKETPEEEEVDVYEEREYSLCEH